MGFVGLIIVIIIVLIIVIFIKKSADKANAERLEKEKIERDKKAKAEADAKKAKYEVITEVEKQQLLKLGGNDLLNVTTTAFGEAIKGNTDEMVFLAITIYRSLLKNPAKTAYWLEKAANAGDPEGLYWYGECYMSGYGVPENRVEGVSMIMDAARKGNKTAIESLKENGMTVAEMRSIGVPV